MKKLLLALLLLAANFGRGYAQQAPADYEAPRTAFADSINRVFAAVDKSRINSGILEEYGLQFIDHAPFTGTNGFTVDNQLDINRWRAIYGDLQGARINTNSASMVSLASANQALDLYARDAYVELPILHYNYHSIATDALSAGRIRSVNNRLFDVAEQNPYQLNSAFAVAASNAALPSANTSFVFRPDLFWTNTGRIVATLQADFADSGGFVVMNWNVPLPVSYTSSGAKDVRVRVSYTDGSIFESHLRVLSPAPVPQAKYAGVASLPSFTLTADKSFNGATASALISVEYGGQNKATPDPAVLDKPLIVVKGFDVSGILPTPNNFSPIDGRFNYLSFVKLSLNEGGINLSNGADLDGYDIVYVDFDNGVDYIQRNAFLLERVIRWVNQNKTGTQPNAMLAMSMGGLIAQYALCDIEQHPANTSYPHQVGLLITHDSPHQGANVPLSVQMSVRHLAGTVIRNPLPFSDDIKLVDRLPILGQARDALLSPAAQQLLRYQTTRQVTGLGFPGQVVAAQTSLYDSFQQEYQALLGSAKVPVGTPGQPCRVVASSNGSECGRGQPFEPYAELVRYSFNDNVANFKFLDGLTLFGTAASAAGYGLLTGLIGGPVAIAGAGLVGLVALGFTGAYDLTAEYRLNALPDQQQQSIYYVFARVNKRTRLFGLFRVQVTLLDFQGYSLASQLPIDSGSGGSIRLADYTQQLGGASALPVGIIKVSQFCFVPTHSALNIALTGSPALRAQYSPGTNVGTPFANFRTAARQNEGHVEFTALNSTWMLQELRQTPQMLSCLAFCQVNPVVSGPSTICSTGSTYSIPGLPAGTTVDWVLTTTTGVTLASGSGPTFTTAFLSGVPSHGTLQATIRSDCGEFSITKQLDVGVAISVSSIPDSRCGIVAQANIIGCENVVWIVNGTEQPIGTVNDGNREFFEYVNGRVTVALRGTNSCTGALITSRTVTKTGSTTGGRLCGARLAPLVTLYPNPAHEFVNVRVQNVDLAQPLTVRIFNNYGVQQLEQSSTGQETIRLKLHMLPAGLYLVHVIQNQSVLSRQQLQVEK